MADDDYVECERCKSAVPIDTIDEIGYCELCNQEVWEDEGDDDA